MTFTTTGVVPWVNIDTPAANAALSGTVTVSGWALEALNVVGANAVSSVTIQVDGTTVGTAYLWRSAYGCLRRVAGTAGVSECGLDL